MRRRFVLPTVVLLLLCVVARADESAAPWAAPSLDRATFVVDGKTSNPISLESLSSEISKADAVFLGEAHSDDTTHRLQLHIFEKLIELREGKVVLAMEMFERDVQKHLDAYLAGEIKEQEFLKKSRPWGNYVEAYRPLVELAKANGIRVVASNFPLTIRRKLGRDPKPVLDSLPDDEKKLVPKQYLANRGSYWRRVDNAVRGHGAMMPKLSEAQRLYSTQSLWDNAMGEACADALDANPGYLVLHVNGGFHSAYWDGTVYQFQQRKPEAIVKTVAIEPTFHPATARTAGVPVADYVARVEARATNLDQGRRTVNIGSRLSYLFHLPKAAAKGKEVPLLIWLVEDGLTASEGMQLCRQRFGDQVAIVAVEPRFRETQPDMTIGGRWFWTDTFASDTGTMVGGIEEIWSYVLRHFPIDVERVCIAGERTGATVVAVVGTNTTRMAGSYVAFDPKGYARIKEFSLPQPNELLPSAQPKRTVLVVGDETTKTWWNSELAEYRDVGIDASFLQKPSNPWTREQRQTSVLAQQLKLETADTSKEETGPYILISAESARARHWGRLQANWYSGKGNQPVAILTENPNDQELPLLEFSITPNAARQPGFLPRCPGPFGGTTVVVLGKETSADELAKWKSLEEDDPLNKKSRFHRLRIATLDGEASIATVLEALKARGRTNVLIAPATFYAKPDRMKRLSDAAKPFADEMTLHWLPGLGGRKGILQPGL